jgi:HAD superfamily hydrolase (TIGR01509 family)
MPLELERIRAICFDVDGTLSDTDDRWVARLEQALRPLAWAFPQRDVRPFARGLLMELESPGNWVYEMLDRINLDDEAGRLLNFLSRRRKERVNAFWLVPGVDKLLAGLHPHWPLAVVSARGELSTLAFLDQFSLRPYFHTVATALTCTHTKPFADPIVWAAAQMGVDPQACLMVGDTTVDIRAGKAAGAQTIGVLCGFGARRELERAGADLIVSSTADLSEILAGQQNS